MATRWGRSRFPDGHVIRQSPGGASLRLMGYVFCRLRTGSNSTGAPAALSAAYTHAKGGTEELGSSRRAACYLHAQVPEMLQIALDDQVYKLLRGPRSVVVARRPAHFYSQVCVLIHLLCGVDEDPKTE